MPPGTKPQGRGWGIDDEVTALRIVGTDTRFELAGANEWTIGTGASCSIRLDDDHASRNHARVYLQGGWWLEDAGSTNGTRCDGNTRSAFQLAPGVQIGIGSISLVAESARLGLLRAFLGRLLGWSPAQRLAVDAAVQAVRDMATRRAVLGIIGAGDLVPTVRRLHMLAVGPDQPFVVIDTVDAARAALTGPATGTVCTLATLPPRELDALVSRALLPDIEAGLVICGDDLSAVPARIVGKAFTVIAVPAIGDRPRGELDRMLLEFADDAVAELGLGATGFREHELVWLRDITYDSVAEVADVALRVVALRNLGVTAGATRLGITHAALSRWARRRQIPT